MYIQKQLGETPVKGFRLGDFSEGGTPVPIPNTEVKLFNADGSVIQSCKSR